MREAKVHVKGYELNVKDFNDIELTVHLNLRGGNPQERLKDVQKVIDYLSGKTISKME